MNKSSEAPNVFIDSDSVTWERVGSNRLKAHSSGSGSSCCCSFLTDGVSEIIFADGQPVTVCDLEA